MAISMLKIRRPLGRLIFNMGIAIPGKTVFLIDTAPLAAIKPFKNTMAGENKKLRTIQNRVGRDTNLYLEHSKQLLGRSWK